MIPPTSASAPATGAVFDGPNDRKWFSYRSESKNKAHGLFCIDPFEVDSKEMIKTIAPTIELHADVQ